MQSKIDNETPKLFNDKYTEIFRIADALEVNADIVAAVIAEHKIVPQEKAANAMMDKLYHILERDFNDYPLLPYVVRSAHDGETKEYAVNPRYTDRFWSALRKVLRGENWNQVYKDYEKYKDEEVMQIKTRYCATLKKAKDALNGVIRVADRKTIEFDAARDAIAKIETALGETTNAK